jgi:hypothetical protein
MRDEVSLVALNTREYVHSALRIFGGLKACRKESIQKNDELRVFNVNA